MDGDWHYVHRGTQYGPVSADWIRREISVGGLTPTTPVWTASMPAWAPALTLPEFAHTPPPYRGSPVPAIQHGDDSLTGNEYLWFTLAFVLVPFVNVLVSSALYYAWRGSSPNRANQINRLGWIVYGCELLLALILGGSVTALRWIGM